jgi:hypothetical protein
MSDISKCYGGKFTGGTFHVCSKRDTCRRYTAPSGLMQYWTEPGSDYQPDKGCDKYWEVYK